MGKCVSPPFSPPEIAAFHTLCLEAKCLLYDTTSHALNFDCDMITKIDCAVITLCLSILQISVEEKLMEDVYLR